MASAARPAPPPIDLPPGHAHGTHDAYKNHGCRCVACRETWRQIYAKRAHRLGYYRPKAVYLAERYPEPPPHGTETRYGRTWRCRCAECREAARLGRARRRLRVLVSR